MRTGNKKLFLALSLIFAFACSKGIGVSGKKVNKWKPSSELIHMIDFKNDLRGFKKTYGPNFYGKDSIYDYVDGGADKYLDLGFVEVMAFEIENVKNTEEKLIIDIFNMQESKNAEALFQKEKSGSPQKIEGGLSAVLSENMVQFAKDKYYVKITSFKGSRPEIFRKLANNIASKITSKT